MSNFSYAHHTVVITIENPESFGESFETTRALLFAQGVEKWYEFFEGDTFLSCLWRMLKIFEYTRTENDKFKNDQIIKHFKMRVA